MFGLFNKQKKNKNTSTSTGPRSNDVKFPENIPDLNKVSDFNFQFFEDFSDFIYRNDNPKYAQDAYNMTYEHLFTEVLKRYNNRTWSSRDPEFLTYNCHRSEGVLLITDLKEGFTYLLFREKWLQNDNEILDIFAQDPSFWYRVERRQW